MKITRKLNILALSALFIGFTACGDAGGGKKEKSGAEKSKSEKKEKSHYGYNADQTEVGWTAYKFTEKTGVSGIFEEVEITAVQEAETVTGVFEGAEYSIAVSSINSNDEGRDHKILEYFFGELENTETITGALKSFNDDGTAVFTINMNGNVKEVEGIYTVEGNTVEMETDIDVTNWDASHALESLNKICEELHIGEDGKSVLWPDVKIKITSTVDKK